MRPLKKIISGGQTGVDQAALQAAIDSVLSHGGWCPPGRSCESGLIPKHFNLKETPQERDVSAPNIPRSQRTIWNVRDSDGSLIFWDKQVSELQSNRGTKLGIDTSIKLGKPFLVVDFVRSDEDHRSEEVIVKNITSWIAQNDIEILSIGGPSEATSPGIYGNTYTILRKLF